ncbi:hypothetical protein [Chromobacterium haemolyticum]|nr:hypothetical protein [Chromobacterium haemolyticum]
MAKQKNIRPSPNAPSMATIFFSWLMVPSALAMTYKASHSSVKTSLTIASVYLAIAIALTGVNIWVMTAQKKTIVARAISFVTLALSALLFPSIFIISAYYIGKPSLSAMACWFLFLLIPINSLKIHIQKFNEAVILTTSEFSKKGGTSTFLIVNTITDRKAFFINKLSQSGPSIAMQLIFFVSILSGFLLRNFHPAASSHLVALGMSFVSALIMEGLFAALFYCVVFISAQNKLACRIPPLFHSPKQEKQLLKNVTLAHFKTRP